MRQAQLLFLEELIQCDYQLRLELDERLLALHRTDLRVSNEADLLGLLLNVTEYLIAGGSVRTDSRGYGLVVIEQRFQKNFGANTEQAYFDAVYGTGQGLRGIINQFVDYSVKQLIQGTLTSIIRSFFEITYGPRLERDYGLMHEDGKAYFHHFQGIIPASVFEKQDEFIKGSTFIKNLKNGTEIISPKMTEVYQRHPELINRHRALTP